MNGVWSPPTAFIPMEARTMTAPLITGPHPRPKRLGRYPSAPAGAIVVAEHSRDGWETITPGHRVGFMTALTLRDYYVVRRRSSTYEDDHTTLSSDLMVQFRIRYSFSIELSDIAEDPTLPTVPNPRDGHVHSLKPDQLDPMAESFLQADGHRTTWRNPLSNESQQVARQNAIAAVHFYSRYADPVPYFRTRFQQLANVLSRQWATGNTGTFNKSLLSISMHGHPALRSAGMELRLEQWQASPKPRRFDD